MPVYPTPHPVAATVDLTAGTIDVVVADRPETSVEVRPSDPSRRADVEAAEATRVECAAERLLVKMTSRWKAWSPFSYGGSVDVELRLPTGSSLTASSALGSVRVAGPAGELRIRAAGDIDVEQAASARMSTALGDIVVGRCAGELETAATSGDVRIDQVAGSAQVKTANGNTRIGTATGPVRVSAANGDTTIEHATGPLVLKSAKGDIRVGSATGESISADTGYGDIEIGVGEGRAAWLDLSTGYGQVRNRLDAGGPPEPGEPVLELRARSGYGDLTVRRAALGGGVPEAATMERTR